MSTLKIRISGERLAAAYDNDLGYYLTPGSSIGYWGSQASFRYDRCVATPIDIADANSIDINAVRKQRVKTYSYIVPLDPI